MAGKYKNGNKIFFVKSLYTRLKIPDAYVLGSSYISYLLVDINIHSALQTGNR